MKNEITFLILGVVLFLGSVVCGDQPTRRSIALATCSGSRGSAVIVGFDKSTGRFEAWTAGHVTCRGKAFIELETEGGQFLTLTVTKIERAAGSYDGGKLYGKTVHDISSYVVGVSDESTRVGDSVVSAGWRTGRKFASVAGQIAKKAGSSEYVSSRYDHGMSGGGVFNKSGDLVGIITHRVLDKANGMEGRFLTVETFRKQKFVERGKPNSIIKPLHPNQNRRPRVRLFRRRRSAC